VPILQIFGRTFRVRLGCSARLIEQDRFSIVDRLPESDYADEPTSGKHSGSGEHIEKS